MADWLVEASAEDESVPTALLGMLEDMARWAMRSQACDACELSIALVSDATISGLNEQYLSHSGPTDVISFPLQDTGSRLVGDIYIGLDQAMRQAAEVGVPRDEELLRLVVHGVLHVLGWDHPEGLDSEMYRRQEEIVRGFLAATGRSS